MDGGKFFKQIDREESLIHLMRVNLLKRMESSICSFAITVRKLLAMVNSILDRIEKFERDSKTEGLDFKELSINDIEIDSEELADLLEVMHAVAAARGSSISEIEQIRKEKAVERGGFAKRVLLLEIQTED